MFKTPLGLNKTAVEDKPTPKTDSLIPKEMIIKDKDVPKDIKRFADAIKKAEEIIDNGGTKTEAAAVIYALISNEDKEVIHKAFIQGCKLTEKGAITYRYNLIRKAKKSNTKT